jgi:hypothetical protein
VGLLWGNRAGDRRSWTILVRHYLCGKRGRGTKKEKSTKKERKEGLWKLTLLWKSAKIADSHSSLKRASQKTLGFFTVPTGPTTRISIYCIAGSDPP